MSCSIIICTYNGREKLRTTLQSIINQETDFLWELIVVDNNSGDGTLDFVSNVLKNSGIDFRVEQFPQPGKMYAFWFALFLAKYEFVLDCDDDNELASNYLQEGLETLNRFPHAGALGALGILPKDEVPEWFFQFSKSYALGPQGKHLVPLPSFSHLYGAGCFYRKSILLKLRDKGFYSLLSCRKGDELSSGGDVEFCHAIQLAGYDLIYSEKLSFLHHIEEKRLNFQYYLNLKKGISGSFPILSSYRLDLYPTQADFFKYLVRSFFLLLKGVIKTSLVISSSYHEKVDYVVVRAKMKALLKNYKLAFQGFQRNKEIFGG